jgi:hypothetical protein
MTTPCLVVRIDVLGHGLAGEERYSTLIVLSEAEFNEGKHLAEALHRAERLRGLERARVVDVRRVTSAVRPHRPLRARATGSR